jgi:hypothetical protein
MGRNGRGQAPSRQPIIGVNGKAAMRQHYGK